MLILRDFDIWFCYAAFLDTPRIDLSDAGHSLLKSGLGLLAMERDGYTWWRLGGTVESGHTEISVDADKNAATLTRPRGQDSLPGGAEEAWLQSCTFRFNELKLLSGHPRHPPRYIRVLLPKAELAMASEGFTVAVSPTIKLFENGVLLVEFRYAAEDHKIPIDLFLARYANLSSLPFDSVHVAPRVAKLWSEATLYSPGRDSVLERARMLRYNQELHEAVDEATARSGESGPRSSSLVPLPTIEDSHTTLPALARTVFDLAAFATGHPRKGSAFLLLGQKELPRLGNYWSGRPHIHLNSFTNQGATATENIDRFSDEFQAILHRLPTVPDPQPNWEDLPADLRPFNDYSVFVNEAVTLWVRSTAGKEELRRDIPADRDLLAAPSQVIVEFLEYGLILHRSLLSRIKTSSSSDDVIGGRWAVHELRSSLLEASQFGEIRTLLIRGWQALGIESLQDQIEGALSIRQDQAALYEARHGRRVGMALRILFGLIALPTFALEVIAPVWRLLRLPMPIDPQLEQLMYIGVSAAIVVPIVFGMSIGIGRREALSSD